MKAGGLFIQSSLCSPTGKEKKSALYLFIYLFLKCRKPNVHLFPPQPEDKLTKIIERKERKTRYLTRTLSPHTDIRLSLSVCVCLYVYDSKRERESSCTWIKTELKEAKKGHTLLILELKMHNILRYMKSKGKN